MNKKLGFLLLAISALLPANAWAQSQGRYVQTHSSTYRSRGDARSALKNIIKYSKYVNTRNSFNQFVVKSKRKQVTKRELNELRSRLSKIQKFEVEEKNNDGTEVQFKAYIPVGTIRTRQLWLKKPDPNEINEKSYFIVYMKKEAGRWYLDPPVYDTELMD